MSGDPLYIKDSDNFIPTDRTNSPWSPTLLHGGAIAGILAYGLEQALPNPSMRFIRITNDLFRPAPKKPLQLHTELVRDGGRICVIQCKLIIDDKEVARATGLAAKVQDIELPEYAHSKAEAPPPHQDLPIKGFLGEKAAPNKYIPGLNYAIDVKLISGFNFQGEGKAWLRMTSPLIEGEDNSPLTYMGILSDFGNGLGQAYLGGENACINADIGLSLYRYPESQWIYLDSVTQVQAHGFGTTETFFIDEQGPVGKVTQSLIVKSIKG
ncbi:MAG TPA: thioesterase family protein [Pseudomonadales bacterium]